MGRTLLVIVALCFLLLARGTNGGRSYPTAQEGKIIPVVDLNVEASGRSLEVDPKLHNETEAIRQLIGQVSPLGESGATLFYYARHQTEPGGPDAYSGFMATMDVYGCSLSREQESLASFWIVNVGDGAISSLNAIHIGWEVSPYLYGDSRTHLFSVWTSDGFQKTGCRNMKCPGFRSQSGSAIAPGDAIDPVSQAKGVKQNITLKVQKDSASGDWLVHYGFNRDPALIGRFPKSLFSATGLADKATDIRFGGTVTTRTTNLAPMGSGYLPTDSSMAASFSNIHLIDQNGRASLVTHDLPFFVSNRDTYTITPIADGRFFYGGPLQPAT